MSRPRARSHGVFEAPSPGRRRAWAVAASAILAFGAGGWAQSLPQGSFLEALDVRLVNVEVLVTDKNGVPVTDLGVGDFELREDGKKVRITHFQGPAAGVDAAATELELAGYVVLLVDNLAIDPAAQKLVLAGAREYLDRHLDSGLRFAVVSFDGYLRVRQTFTRDRQLLHAALDDLERLSALGLARRNERWAALRESLETLRSIQRLALDDARGGEVARYMGNYTTAVRAYATKVQRETGEVLYALSHMVNALGALPGSKALIYVSEGLPMRPGDEFYQTALDVMRDLPTTGGTDAERREASIDNRSAQLGMLSDVGQMQRQQGRSGGGGPQGLQQLTATANANRVSFYALKSPGYGSAGLPAELAGDLARLYAPSVQTVREQNLLETLQAMAADTGGDARVGTGVADLLERAGADLRQQYSLGFSPGRPADGEFHELEVKVKRKGVRLRSRKGYIDKTLGAKLADRATTSLLLGIGDNPHGVRLELGAVREGPRKDLANVVLIVHIPLRDLLMTERDGVYAADTQIFVAARDERGQAAPVQGLGLRIEAERSPAEQPDQVFSGQLPFVLRRVAQRVGLAFVDPVGGSASFVGVDLDLARPSGS